MLRIAVPNKGPLSEPAISVLVETRYKTRHRGRKLVLTDSMNDVELFFLRSRNIAMYARRGPIQAGITSRDLLLNSGTNAIEHRALSFTRSTFRFAALLGKMTSLVSIAGKRVGASYDHLIRRYLIERGIEAEVVRLDDAVEPPVRLGAVSLVADIVETGSTLKATGLKVFEEPILELEAVLITREDCVDNLALATLDRRLQGVQLICSYVPVDYNVRKGDLDTTIEIVPGFDSPTVSPLMNPEWRAVRVMVLAKGVNLAMDRLYEARMRGITVTKLAASRL